MSTQPGCLNFNLVQYADTGQLGTGLVQVSTFTFFTFHIHLFSFYSLPFSRVTHVSNTFPSNIRHAVCKSGGCFIDGQEDNSFNSVPVYQSQMVLKKRPCKSHQGRYYFEVDFMNVAVACICVHPRY